MDITGRRIKSGGCVRIPSRETLRMAFPACFCLLSAQHVSRAHAPNSTTVYLDQLYHFLWWIEIGTKERASLWWIEIGTKERASHIKVT